MLTSCTGLLPVHTWTVISLFLWNVECPLFKWLASHSRSGGMPLVSPHSATNSHLSSSVSANLTLLWKWLDGCDDSGLSFCLKVIKLCPSASAGLSFCLKVIKLCPSASAPWLRVYSFYMHNLIPDFTS